MSPIGAMTLGAFLTTAILFAKVLMDDQRIGPAHVMAGVFGGVFIGLGVRLLISRPVRFETSTKIHEFGVVNETSKWEETLAAKAQPAVDFVVRTGEIMLLAGAFQVAANATDNQALDVFAGIMFIALSMHIAFAWSRFIYLPLQRLEIKSWFSAIIILASIPLAIWLLTFLSDQIRGAAKALVPSEVEIVG